MYLVPFTKMLDDARKHHYAVGAFNIINMETLQAVSSIAEEKNTPVILQTFFEHVNFGGPDYYVALADTAAKKYKTPICLSLDHGKKFEMAIDCINAGYTGVMIDLATSDYDKNVETTKKVVNIAHSHGISVEAELGKIFNADEPVETRNSAMTDPKVAKSFAKDTGIDALAVSVGTAHGIYSSKPQIDFERLGEILDIVDSPIVVHGGSNTPDDDIKRIVKMGVSKVNIGTDLMMGFTKGVYDVLSKDQKAPIDEVLKNGRKSVQDVVSHKIDLLTAYRI